MKHSICMTNYNTEDVIEASLESIISRIDPDEFEIVVVDNKSTDRSAQILRDYDKRLENFSVITKRCSRGIGRQTAFEQSSGNLIVTADVDTVYTDVWMELIRTYLSRGFTFGLSSWFCQIYPRDLLLEVGGWSDLQYMEDVELWCRLAKIGRYRTYPMVCGENLKRNPASNQIERTVRRYLRFRDKATLFSHIPFSLYAKGYFRRITEKYSGFKMLSRLSYYLTLMSLAELGSNVRRLSEEYGNIRFLAENLENIRIDLNLVGKSELVVPKYEFSTREECLRAYAEKDYSFLPGFYD